jgi:ribose/xylose/arabinose/galactoside ABC-type transport system permease subunit
VSGSTVAELRGRVAATPESVRALGPIVGVLVLLGVYGASSSDRFLTATNFQILFGQIAVLGVLAVGAMLLIIAGQMDLSVGSGVSLLSVIGAKMLAGGSSQLVVAIVLIALGTAIGMFIGLIVAWTRVQPFILTLGALGVLYAIALILSQQQPVPVELQFSSLSLNDVGGIPLSGLLVVGLCLLGAVILRYTRLGRNAYALGSNEEASYLAGVPIASTKIALYSLNGALVGVAAIMLIARLGSGDPNGGAGLELLAITAVVLGGASLFGGVGTMLGAFLGTLLLGTITNVLQIAGVATTWEHLVSGAVLMVAVTWAAIRELRRSSTGPRWRSLRMALTRRSAAHEPRTESE